jgi:Protein of unknown function (DUF2867)
LGLPNQRIQYAIAFERTRHSIPWSQALQNVFALPRLGGEKPQRIRADPLAVVARAALASADFFDAFEVLLTDGRLSPTEIFLRSVGATPPWVTALMSIRNRVVRLFGLKDVGQSERRQKWEG